MFYRNSGTYVPEKSLANYFIGSWYLEQYLVTWPWPAFSNQYILLHKETWGVLFIFLLKTTEEKACKSNLKTEIPNEDSMYWATLSFGEKY